MKKKIRAMGALTLAAAMAASIMPANIGKAYTPGNYSYFDEYSLGYSGRVVAYEKGSKVSTSLQSVGATVYDTVDNKDIFKPENGEQAWDADELVLTQPVRFTTNDGVVHDVESMLTNFDFIADPTAIDNSDVDGKLYVYGTTEGIHYSTGDPKEDTINGKLVPEGQLKDNQYKNHSLTILSTSDMVNWTDEGFMDSQNLTNEPSYSDSKVIGGFTSGASWAPSGLKIDGDGDGEDEYYIFYTNGGATGYVMGDSPVGPWEEPLGKALFDHSTPNCSDCNTCFDPAVLVDDKGKAYVYFGGLSVTSGRACEIKFEEGTGYVERVGDPVKLPTYFMFEDNEINQFNGLYYYSYCSNFDGSQKLTKTASICVYVSSDPLNISFDPLTRPKGEEKDPFTDENGVYRHFLGTVLDNPSTIYGQSYNNHHHMQAFKDHTYIFYHSTVLNNTLHRASRQYRNLHVDEIKVDKDTDEITCEPSYEGAAQIESFNPYIDFKGNAKEINATTTSYSAGVCSRRSDARVEEGLSPMVLDEIDTGDWTKIQGVDFGSIGANKFEVTYASETDNAAIELFVDDPTNASNLVATVPLSSTGDQDVFMTESVDIANKITGEHDIYFVFRGTDYDVASWKFSDGVTGVPKPSETPVPQVTPSAPAPSPSAPAASPAPDYTKTYKVGKLNYKIAANGTATFVGPVKKTDKSAKIPASVTVDGKAYKVTSIAANAFKNCKKLTSVTIGANINKIGSKAFYNCKALKKITVKSSVIKSVGGKALKGTSSRLTIKVPKKKAVAYKKIFKGKGQGKRARIK